MNYTCTTHVIHTENENENENKNNITTTTNIKRSENRAQVREETQNVENSEEASKWHPPSNPFKDSEEFPDEIVHGLNNEQRWFISCFFEEFYPDIKPLSFILYNAERGWGGENGEDVRQHLEKYMRRWCDKKEVNHGKRKAGLS